MSFCSGVHAVYQSAHVTGVLVEVVAAQLCREIHIGRQCCLAQRTHTSSAMTAASVEGPRLEHLRLQLLSQSTCLSV